MTQIRLNVSGDLAERIRAMPAIAEAATGPALLLAAYEIVNDAIPRAPYKLGTLRASITAIQVSPYRVEVGPQVGYGVYVEFGTGLLAEGGNGRQTPWVYRDPISGAYITTAGERPRPFMRPAFEAQRQAVQDVFAAQMIARLAP